MSPSDDGGASLCSPEARLPVNGPPKQPFPADGPEATELVRDLADDDVRLDGHSLSDGLLAEEQRPVDLRARRTVRRLVRARGLDVEGTFVGADLAGPDVRAGLVVVLVVTPRAVSR